jgi:terminase small subunit / prophage DNA-packing protein
MAIVGRTELGRRWNVSPPTIQNYITRGMPVVTVADRDKGIPWEFDTDECDEWLKEYEDERSSRVNDKDDTEENSAIIKARIEKLQVETKRLELRLSRERGELVPINDVARIVEQQYTTVRSHLLALPNKLAPMVAGKTDIAELNSILTSYINEALSELVTDAVMQPEGDSIEEENTDSGEEVLLDGKADSQPYDADTYG